MIEDQDYLWKLNKDNFWNNNKDKILMKLVSGERVLDVAGGTGSFSLKLAYAGKDVTYIDLSKKYYKIAKERAKQQGAKIEFICDDFTTHKFKDKFDCIVLGGFIEHIKDDVGLLQIIYDLLKPKGRIVLLTSAYPWLYSNFDEGVGHYRRYSKQGLKQKMQKSGFEVEFMKYWDIIGIPVLVMSKLFGRMLVSDTELNNKFLNNLLDKWFQIFENKMIIPLGLSLFAMGEKQENENKSESS